MYELLPSVVRLDTVTLLVVGVLIFCCAYMLQHAFSSAFLTITFLPGIAVGALAGVLVGHAYGMRMHVLNDVNIVLAAGAGAIAALIIMIVMARCWLAYRYPDRADN